MSSIVQPSPAGALSATGAGSVAVRKALLSDVRPLVDLINRYASTGIMLPRTEAELSENVRDFTVAEAGGRLMGCGALHFYGPTTAEVRSLAVDPGWKNHGVGRLLMEAIEAEATVNAVQTLFAFTYVPGFFGRFGFVEVDRGSLPSKVWKDCLRCPKFQCCDEIAMRKILLSTLGVNNDTLICGDAIQRQGNDDTGVILPVIRKDTVS